MACQAVEDTMYLYTALKKSDQECRGHFRAILERQVIGVFGEPFKLYGCEKLFRSIAWPDSRCFGLVARFPWLNTARHMKHPHIPPSKTLQS